LERQEILAASFQKMMNPKTTYDSESTYTQQHKSKSGTSYKSLSENEGIGSSSAVNGLFPPAINDGATTP